MTHPGSTKERLDRIETVLSTLLTQVTHLMATEQDLQTDLDAIKAGVASLAAQITSLQQQLAAGSPVTQAQLDALDTEAKAIVAALPPPPAPPAA